MLSAINDRVKSARVSKPELALLLILLLFGVPMILLIPPGAGYDEEDHLVRVWEMSTFSFIPGQLPPQELKYPTVFRDFAYRQQGSDGLIDADFWQSFSRAGLYERGFVRREIDTKSVYSPALLLPQALTMRILGRSLDRPALIVFYLCRFAGLLSYLILVWLAIRWIPFGKWILLVLAVIPMALFQAATLSPDAISNGIGFLFVAGCLQLARVEKINGREAGSLLLLIFLLFLAKLNLIPLILLPFLLIVPSRFSSRRLYIFLIAITLGLFLVEVVGWNWIASRNFASLLLEEANPRAQLLYILGHPFAFLQTLLRDFAANGLLYVQGWINGYGYYYWTPPLLISFLFLLSLAVSLLVDSTSEELSNKDRAVFLLLFLGGYVATIVSIYTSFAPVGSGQVVGVQGRYFITLALPFFLVISSLWSKKKFTPPSQKWIMVFLVPALSLNLLGLFFSFHVPCGSTYYQTGLCYHPLFRDFPSRVRSSPPISHGRSITQEIQAACNGLAEVRVFVRSSAGRQGTTRFILEEASSGQTLIDTSIPNDRVREETWYPLRFGPDWDSAGKQYILKILGAAEPGLQVLYTTQPEFNLGDSYENDQLLEEDLVLQYGCMTGLRKLWLTGKP